MCALGLRKGNEWTWIARGATRSVPLVWLEVSGPDTVRFVSLAALALVLVKGRTEP